MYKKQKIHFVGIGGVGMSGIAEVLINLGYTVSGSDLKQSNITQRLTKRGASVMHGHRKQNVGDADVVVLSSAIKENNPEVIEATKRELPIIQRAEMLAELMRFSRYGIAVAGTHGKTTTTSLIASVLYKGGNDPTMIIGGKVNGFRSNARLGRGDFMVAEADESDGSFLKLSPTIVVITSIDREHMDYYKNFEFVESAYLSFTQKIPFYGAAVCCLDHPIVKKLIKKVDKRVITYGFSPEANFCAVNLRREEKKTSFDLMVNRAKKGRLTLNMPGDHNVLNSLASIAVASELEIPLGKVKQALKSFKGIQRRCQVLLKNSAVTVIDDYGHHPEEIKATIQTIRGSFAGRLITVFQPHRYSRTKDLFNDFLGAFDRTNVLILTDIYPAGETPIKGIHAQKMAHEIKKGREKEVMYIPLNNKIVAEILKVIQPGDVILTLGAGDITRIGSELAKSLRSFE